MIFTDFITYNIYLFISLFFVNINNRRYPTEKIEVYICLCAVILAVNSVLYGIYSLGYFLIFNLN
jgi:hypothetical protein